MFPKKLSTWYYTWMILHFHTFFLKYYFDLLIFHLLLLFEISGYLAVIPVAEKEMVKREKQAVILNRCKQPICGKEAKIPLAVSRKRNKSEKFIENNLSKKEKMIKRRKIVIIHTVFLQLHILLNKNRYIWLLITFDPEFIFILIFENKINVH